MKRILIAGFLITSLSAVKDNQADKKDSEGRLILKASTFLQKLPPPSYFQKFAAIAELCLDDTGVSEWQVGGLATLVSLRRLSISNARLDKLGAGWFKGLPLRRLNVSGNQIEDFEPGWDEGLEGLFSLDISRNPIERFGPGIFMRLTQLSVLKADHCKLRSIGLADFVGLGELTELDLSYNRIQRLSSFAETLYGRTSISNAIHDEHAQIQTWADPLKRLRYLNISHNAMTALLGCMFPERLFGFNLDASHNEIRLIDRVLAKKVRRLTLHGNQLLPRLVELRFSYGFNLDVDYAHRYYGRHVMHLASRREFDGKQLIQEAAESLVTEEIRLDEDELTRILQQDAKEMFK